MRVKNANETMGLATKPCWFLCCQLNLWAEKQLVASLNHKNIGTSKCVRRMQMRSWGVGHYLLPTQSLCTKIVSFFFEPRKRIQDQTEVPTLQFGHDQNTDYCRVLSLLLSDFGGYPCSVFLFATSSPVDNKRSGEVY